MASFFSPPLWEQRRTQVLSILRSFKDDVQSVDYRSYVSDILVVARQKC
jgi:hypothetical protein